MKLIRSLIFLLTVSWASADRADSPAEGISKPTAPARVCPAFANRSREAVSAGVTSNVEVLPAAGKGKYRVKVIADIKPTGDVTLGNGRFPIQVGAMGQTAVVIGGLKATPGFQRKLLAAQAVQGWKTDCAEIGCGNTRAMILNFGPAAKTACAYLLADDSKFKEVAMIYTIPGQEARKLSGAAYSFGFTVPLPTDASGSEFRLNGRTADGRLAGSETVVPRH